jgi:hypothetical protein
MSARPLVLRSVEAPGGHVCIDVLKHDGSFSWAECRRDPEDGHGWRHTGAGRGGFGSAEDAERDARRTLGWP